MRIFFLIISIFIFSQCSSLDSKINIGIIIIDENGTERDAVQSFFADKASKYDVAYLNIETFDAVSQGAQVVNEDGGTVQGTYMTPAVVFPVKSGMRLYSAEKFGTIVPIAACSEIEEPMDYVTESDYGQQVSLSGSDQELIADLIDPLVNQVCRVNINSQCQRGPDTFPFTGRKDSAEGTLSVSDALKVFSIRTLVAAKETDENRRIIKSIVTKRSSQFLSTDFIL